MHDKTTSSPYLTTKEAASYLRLQPSTLERWRYVGDGPAFRKFGRRVVYSQQELEAFAESARRASTADRGSTTC